jgi:hypothetical protein
MNSLKIVFVFILTVITTGSKADICITSFEADTAHASAIFVGRVANIVPYSFWHNGQAYNLYNFVVHQSFKGLSEYESIVTVVSPFGGCCGSFREDTSYLIFAYKENAHAGFYYTNDCSMSESLSSEKTASMINRLGAFITHEQKASEEETLRQVRLLLEAKPAEQQLVDVTNQNIQLTRNLIFYKIAVLGLVVLLCVSLLIIFKRRG